MDLSVNSAQFRAPSRPGFPAAPPPAGAASGSNEVDQPTGTGASTQSEQDVRTDELIEALRSLSAVVGPRSRLSRFRPIPRLPGSDAYQHAKNNMTRHQRALVTEELIKRLGRVGIEPADAHKELDVLQVVWHAQLRTHTPEERNGLRLDYAALIGMGILFSAYTAGTGLVLGLVASRSTRREYNRSPKRPEYRRALNGMMDVMRLANLPDSARRQVAAVLLNQHMRNERTICAADHNAIVHKIAPDDPTQPPRGELIEPPTQGTHEEETARQDLIINLARTGFKSLAPIEKPPSEDAVLQVINGLEEQGLPEEHFDNNCSFTLDKFRVLLSEDNVVVVVYNTASQTSDKNATPQGFEAKSLAKWMFNNGTHPISREPFDLDDLRQLGFRLKKPQEEGNPPIGSELPNMGDASTAVKTKLEQQRASLSATAASPASRF
jgi:hypothetical protein